MQSMMSAAAHIVEPDIVRNGHAVDVSLRYDESAMVNHSLVLKVDFLRASALRVPNANDGRKGLSRKWFGGLNRTMI